MPDVLRIDPEGMQANCYLVSVPAGQAVAIDPGVRFERIEAEIAARELDLRAVLCTHAHFDHLAAAAAVCERYGVAFHLHGDDAPVLRRASFIHRVLSGDGPIPMPEIDVPLADEMTLSFGELTVEVVHAPGHSPGGVCFAIDGELFAGDTIGPDGPGRTDFPEGSDEALRASLRRIVNRYPPDTIVHPGHGEEARLGSLSTESPRQSSAKAHANDG